MKCNECNTSTKCECCNREICPDCYYLINDCQCIGADPELFNSYQFRQT